MKRLIRKANLDLELWDEVKISDDPKYEDMNVNALSLPNNRDGAILVDIKNKVIHWGLNGETHAQLLENHYHISDNSNDTYLDIDNFVSPGVFLKDFLGRESIIMYSTLPETIEIIQNEKPNAYIYEDQYDGGLIMRIAKKSRN